MTKIMRVLGLTAVLGLTCGLLAGCDLTFPGVVICHSYATVPEVSWFADYEGQTFKANSNQPMDIAFSKGYGRYGGGCGNSTNGVQVETSVLQARWDGATQSFIGCGTGYINSYSGYAITSSECAPSDTAWSINSVRAWRLSTYYDGSYENLRCDAPNCHLP